MSSPSVTPAICQIDNCPVLAVGQCVFCGRTFCATHQARDLEGVYVDACAPDYPKTPRGLYKQHRERQAQDNAETTRYFMSGTARKALLAARVPTVELYAVRYEMKPKPRLFDWQASERIEVVTPVGRGWIIGKVSWKWNDPGPHGGTDHDESYLTALVDKDVPASLPDPFSMGFPMRSEIDAYSSEAFARVDSFGSGYRVLPGKLTHFGSLVEGQMQAVKRLIGEES